MTRLYCFRTILPLLVLGFLVSDAVSQRTVATVTINTEKLIQESQEKLINLKDELEVYINNFDWSDNERRYDIPLQVDIFFERAQATSFEDRYDARLVLSNGTDYQASDKRWTFSYMPGKPFTHIGQFDPLTGMLDFYIDIMLGQEYDKMKKLGGDEYYQKANDVMQLSKFSKFFQTGWKERQIHLEKLMSEDRIPLRELEYFFLQAKQWFRLDERKTAGQYLRVIVIKLRGLKKDLEGLDRFYQIHHLDLARMLSVLSLRKELEELIRLDPSNTVTYQQFIDQIQ